VKAKTYMRPNGGKLIAKQHQPNFDQGAKVRKILDICIKSNDKNQSVDINY